VAQAALVFSTALAPFLAGYILDTTVSAPILAMFLATIIMVVGVLGCFAPAPADKEII
jgi:hypothetical protein